MVNYQQIKTLDDPALCAAGGGCGKSTRGYSGFSLLVSYDAGDALAALVKKLIG